VTAWVLFIVYAVATALLAWRGGRSSGSAAGFAIGSGNMNPWIVGITLGATLASSATFVLYPGFVYADGLAALVGFSLPLIAGLLTGLVIFAPRFQTIGADASALTVPHWLGERFADSRLRSFFALLQVLNIAYLVLIVVGTAYVMEAALQVPYHASVLGIVAFVFGYTAVGGATAHAFTNTLQGLMMLVVALLVFFSGAALWPEAAASLATSGMTAEGSVLFSTSFEVWAVPFLIGIALTTQPHLLAKALYVSGPKALRTTVAVGIGTYATYALMLSAGAYARVVLPADIAQDRVVAEYLQVAFTWPPIGAAISVAILAASMSTLDGLLVAVAASVGNDVLPGRGNAWVNRAVLAVLAAATVAIAWTPPQLVLILGQLGVYGLVAASVGPLIAGMVRSGPLARWPVWLGAILPLCIHFGLALTIIDNPGVSAIIAMAVGIPVSLLAAVLPPPAPVEDP
jgi:SSS family solute:Na+ symporter/sodium/pantothenate symporter